MKIPAEGLRGAALREAMSTELGDVANLVQRAVATKIGRDWANVEALYPDRAVIRNDGRYFAYPYSIANGNAVTIGEPVEVARDFISVAMREAAFLEAVGEPDKGVWLIRVIRAGLSGNKNFYPDAVLREAVPLFEGARVFVKSDADHIKGAGKDVRQLIGGLRNPRFVEGASTDSGQVQAELVLINPEEEVAVKLREAHSRGLANLFGFSVDMTGGAKSETRDGKKVRVAKSITKVDSVDLIVEPGAGGELIRLVEAQAPENHHRQEDADMALRERMIEAIKAKKPNFTSENLTDDELEAAYREALTPAAPDASATLAQIQAAQAEALKTLRLVEAQTSARATIAAAKLPQPAKDRLLTRFTEATEPFDAADVEAAIKGERDYLAQFTESGKVNLAFDDIEVEDRSEKMAGMLDAFFDPAHKDHRAVRSFKECYIEVTGDRKVTGLIDDCDRTRLAESMGLRFTEAVNLSGFDKVFGSALRRSLIREYNAAVEYEAWRQIVDVVPVADFRTNERTRFGGYGDIPIVAEEGAYLPLTSPGDEVASYAVAKRGGMESFSLESIKNDDVGAIRRIPIKLGRAMKRTLAKFVFDFIRTNPPIYDGVALFHASHSNLFTAALSAAEVATHRLAMLKQVEAGSNDRLGVGPRHLLVSMDNQEAAVNLFNRSTNLDKTFIQANVLNIIPVWYWTDANDWATVANPRDVPTIEIGFLDGIEEPTLIAQDSPNHGSLFSNDMVTWKIKHTYGGNVLDFRGMTKAVVP